MVTITPINLLTYGQCRAALKYAASLMNQKQFAMLAGHITALYESGTHAGECPENIGENQSDPPQLSL